MLGCAVLLISTAIPIPQAYRIYKDKGAKNVSVGTILTGSIAQCLWISYGYLVHDIYLWTASIPALFIYLFLGYIYLKYK